MSNWQPIETAPKDGSKVDLWVIFENGGHRVTDAYWTGNDRRGWMLGSDGYTQHQYTTRPVVTHWMPIPEAPKT